MRTNVFIAYVNARSVNRKRKLYPLAIENFYVFAALVPHKFVNKRNLSAFFKKRNKIRRHNKPFFGMTPSRECLRTNQRTGIIKLRLKPHFKLTVFHSIFNVGDKLLLIFGRLHKSFFVIRNMCPQIALYRLQGKMRLIAHRE